MEHPNNRRSMERVAAETALALGAPLAPDLIHAITSSEPDQAFSTGCAAHCGKQRGGPCSLRETRERRLAVSLLDLWDGYQRGRHRASFEAHAWYPNQVCPLLAPDDLPFNYGGADVRCQEEDRFCQAAHPRELEQRLWFTDSNAVIITTDVGQPTVVTVTVRAVLNDPYGCRPMDLGQARELLALG